MHRCCWHRGWAGRCCQTPVGLEVVREPISGSFIADAPVPVLRHAHCEIGRRGSEKAVFVREASDEQRLHGGDTSMREMSDKGG